MKAALWRRAVNRYVVPNLPGVWHTTGQLLYVDPLDWLLRGLLVQTSSFSSDFWVEVFVRLLPKPAPGLISEISKPLGHGTGRGRWVAPETVEAAEPVMREITELIWREALPFFDAAGTLDGFAEAVQREVDANPLNIHIQEQLAYTHLLRRDLAAARRALDGVEYAAAADPDPRPWVSELRDRVRLVGAAAERSLDEAIELLGEQADAVRAQYKLPPR